MANNTDKLQLTATNDGLAQVFELDTKLDAYLDIDLHPDFDANFAGDGDERYQSSASSTSVPPEITEGILEMNDGMLAMANRVREIH